MFSDTCPALSAAQTNGINRAIVGAPAAQYGKAAQAPLAGCWKRDSASTRKQSIRRQADPPMHTSPRAHATPRKEGASLDFIEQAGAAAGQQARSKVCTQVLAAWLPDGTDNNRSLV